MQKRMAQVAFGFLSFYLQNQREPTSCQRLLLALWFSAGLLKPLAFREERGQQHSLLGAGGAGF
jgi:hypothetical protein